MPTATAATSRYEPNTLPIAVATAVRRPWASARPITNSTLGPGITITSSDIAAKARKRSVDTMRITPLGGHGNTTSRVGAMELRQLSYFVTVAEELHFGRAAERLHISQSPLSRAIRELERDLGVVLFVRTTRRVELTAAGRLLLERSRRALAEIDGAIADARRSMQTEEAVLVLGY